MRLWTKIKILLGLKKTFCKECRHRRGIQCAAWSETHTNYVTGEKTKSYAFCSMNNPYGRCLWFEGADQA